MTIQSRTLVFARALALENEVEYDGSTAADRKSGGLAVGLFGKPASQGPSPDVKTDSIGKLESSEVTSTRICRLISAPNLSFGDVMSD